MKPVSGEGIPGASRIKSLINSDLKAKSSVLMNLPTQRARRLRRLIPSYPGWWQRDEPENAFFKCAARWPDRRRRRHDKYDVIDSEAGLIHFSRMPGPLTEVN
jgi:hypothetical protein